MREKTSKPALFLLFLALFAPAAFAHPLKPTHKEVSRRSAHAVETVRASAHTRARQTEQAEDRQPAKSHLRPQERRVSDRAIPTRRSEDHHTQDRRAEDRHTSRHSAESRQVDTRRVALRSLHGRRIDAPRAEIRRVDEPRQSSRRHSAPVEEARVDPRSEETPAPETAPVELPPIEVHHDRKIHLTPEAAAPAPDVTRRKATVQDFLDTPAVPAKADPPTAPQSKLTPPAPLPARHTASVVERKLPTLPVATAAPEIVPNPVIEPVLYTARGRLIVPPAMKGSHEILVHQNEMADIDGLTRIQDDADLDRLRDSKQLVALPASAALEVDERLPLNRRFCRPWTAQFLAALARAHYARFHTPLQVNSAVRTVEFQERLRYVNGNAAPAEGETASPHLTGQAVDLAKHGLSMTEIAWMRGYLMPLVQQGKVDVEEEFQQSCFHISVYKKFMPQSAPRRDIPTRRTPATALAAAIH